MKNSLLLSGLFFGGLFLSPTDSHAQWQPDVRLTNDSANSYTSLNNAWCIASSGSVVHVVWWDFRDGNMEIYYKRSPDGGISWSADTRLTNNSSESVDPSVAVSDPLVHVVWYDYRDTNYQIYSKRSPDGGISWEADTRLTINDAQSYSPSVAASGSVVHIVWEDTRDLNHEIYYKRSTDGGISWEADTRLTNHNAASFSPSVALSGSVVHVVWQDARDVNWEIYYKRSTDGGISWSADTRLTIVDTTESNYPSVTVSGSVVHVVWQDFRDGNMEIYYKRSTNAGGNWSADERLTNNPSPSSKPSVAVSGSVVHVVWDDYRDVKWDIYYKRSPDGGVSWEADTRLTNNDAQSYSPSVALSGSVVHVVWADARDVYWEIYYKRNPTGNVVGIKNINSEIPREFSLSQNYPNPFNPSTTIQFSLPRSEFVTLKLFNILGEEITALVSKKLSAGTHQAEWDARDLPSGVYFYRLQAGSFTQTRKLLLLR